MSSPDILIGNIVALTGIFKNQDDENADPSTVILRIKKPDGSYEEDVTPSKTATGIYTYNYTPPTIGLYFYEFIGTGVLVATMQEYFMAYETF